MTSADNASLRPGARTAAVVVAALAAAGVFALSTIAQEQPANAEAGRAAALYERGITAESGSSSPADRAKAAGFYEQSAQLGFAPARTRLGYLYKTGSGVPRDPALAFHWISMAATQGDPEGQFQLALLHLEGVGTPPNPAEARVWLARAGNTGRHQEAQFVLGLLLQNGIGGRRNDGAAFEWMERAARGPNKDVARHAGKAHYALGESIRSAGQQPPISVGAILAVAFAVYALTESSGSTGPYDSSKYNSERQAAKLQCERQCLNRAMAVTRGGLDMSGAYERCRVGC